MKKKAKQILFLILFLGVVLTIHAQNPDEVFIQNNALYKPNSPWVTLGIGGGYNINQEKPELAGSLIYHIDLWKLSFMTGYHLYTSESFLSRSYQTMTNFSAGVGYRIEELKSNMAAFIGPTYTYGKTLVSNDQFYAFNGVGVMVNIEYTYKIFYDVGIGISAFGGFTNHYNVMGLKLHMYFSGAFKTGINQTKLNY